MAVGIGAALLVGGAAIVTAATSLTGTQPQQVSATSNPTAAVVTQGSLNNASCSQARQSVRSFTLDTSTVYSDGTVTIGDWRVPFRDRNFRAAHKSNPALTQSFYSYGWLVPDDPADVPRAIDLFVEQSVVNPDAGGTIDRKKLPDVGWSESAVTLRLKTALCLFRAASTPEEQQELLPVIDALLAANMDEARYYGPPRVRPHNHGVMADRELLNASEVLNRPELAAFAKKRLTTQLDGLYDRCGFTYEQSNGYQHFHASLWEQVARRVADDPVFQKKILDKVTQIQEAANAVTFPDGFTPRIGDGSVKEADDLNVVGKNIRVMCPDTGWFSWREKHEGVQQQVIARFGPGTNYHGHADKGAVVWWAKPSVDDSGVEVLADRGLPGKNRDETYKYAVGPTAHATLLWDGGSSLRLSGSASSAKTVTTLRMSGSNVRGGAWTRTVRMDERRTVLRIDDRLSGKAAGRPATQNFPLDPVWQPTGRVGTYRTDSGLTLTVACTDTKGKRATMKQTSTVDYQLAEPRTALTVTCSIPQGRAGAKAILTVTAP